MGAFLATNMLGNEVAGNNCTDVNQMFDFTRSFPQQPGEGTRPRGYPDVLRLPAMCLTIHLISENPPGKLSSLAT